MKRFINRLIPARLALPIRYLKLKLSGQLDEEIVAIKHAMRSRRRAIDVGTNIGIYTYALSKYCCKVESFEPVTECTKMLHEYANYQGNIAIHNVALSNRSEEAFLFIPFMRDKPELNVGLASINDPGGQRVRLPVLLRRLDDYEFIDVDFIKIDVEGHELEVIEGALETIRREKPVLLVEIEQRHLIGRTIAQVFDYILALGYQGSFLQGGHRKSIDTFSYEQHQIPYLENVFSKRYINNFFFFPR